MEVAERADALARVVVVDVVPGAGVALDRAVGAETPVTAVTAASSSAAILPGQALENPVTGERFTFTDTATTTTTTTTTTTGRLLGFDFQLRSGGAIPIAHVHPIQTERFEVIEGRMRFRTGMRTRIAGPGEVIEIPPGVTHSFANAGDTEARLHVEVRPALAMEQMLAEAHAPLIGLTMQRLLLTPLAR